MSLSSLDVNVKAKKPTEPFSKKCKTKSNNQNNGEYLSRFLDIPKAGYEDYPQIDCEVLRIDGLIISCFDNERDIMAFAQQDEAITQQRKDIEYSLSKKKNRRSLSSSKLTDLAVNAKDNGVSRGDDCVVEHESSQQQQKDLSPEQLLCQPDRYFPHLSGERGVLTNGSERTLSSALATSAVLEDNICTNYHERMTTDSELQNDLFVLPLPSTTSNNPALESTNSRALMVDRVPSSAEMWSSVSGYKDVIKTSDYPASELHRQKPIYVKKPPLSEDSSVSDITPSVQQPANITNLVLTASSILSSSPSRVPVSLSTAPVSQENIKELDLSKLYDPSKNPFLSFMCQSRYGELPTSGDKPSQSFSDSLHPSVCLAPPEPNLFGSFFPPPPSFTCPAPSAMSSRLPPPLFGGMFQPQQCFRDGQQIQSHRVSKHNQSRMLRPPTQKNVNTDCFTTSFNPTNPLPIRVHMQGLEHVLEAAAPRVTVRESQRQQHHTSKGKYHKHSIAHTPEILIPHSSTSWVPSWPSTSGPPAPSPKLSWPNRFNDASSQTSLLNLQMTSTGIHNGSNKNSLNGLCSSDFNVPGVEILSQQPNPRPVYQQLDGANRITKRNGDASMHHFSVHPVLVERGLAVPFTNFKSSPSSVPLDGVLKLSDVGVLTSKTDESERFIYKFSQLRPGPIRLAHSGENKLEKRPCSIASKPGKWCDMFAKIAFRQYSDYMSQPCAVRLTRKRIAESLVPRNTAKQQLVCSPIFHHEYPFTNHPVPVSFSTVSGLENEEKGFQGSESVLELQRRMNSVETVPGNVVSCHNPDVTTMSQPTWIDHLGFLMAQQRRDPSNIMHYVIPSMPSKQSK